MLSISFYCNITLSHHHTIASSCHHSIIILSCHHIYITISSRYRTETYSLSRHHLIPHHITHYCTIMLSTQSQWCDNAIIFMVLSRRYRNNIILSISGGILLTFIHIKQYNSQQILYNHVEFYWNKILPSEYNTVWQCHNSKQSADWIVSIMANI